ncbi:MAG: hypothetical protein DRJ50_13515 [Actinobacteria bacterium]|nr:MAG: hypothetical protein DRJ50_13515 [Actinomycetota bacterium]
MKKRERATSELNLVTTAWIVSMLGVHQSSIEPAWRRGDLEVFAHVAGGNNKQRPIFEHEEAVRWEKERAPRQNA